MLWWDSYRAVYGAELRAAALGLAEHGWPVVPGEFRHGALVPALSALPGGTAAASADPTQVVAWWDRRPFGILLATGSALDVIEVPAEVGRAVCVALRTADQLAPVAATSTGRWWFPIPTGTPLPAELTGRADISLASHGALVAAPPSQCAQGFVHWRVSPPACGWRLPAGELVMRLVVEAATGTDRWPARAREDLDTQRSTAIPIGMRS